VEIFDYSIDSEPTAAVFTPEIRTLLALIPETLPLNPGITQKIRNLVQILLNEKPEALHLWQDTTNVLGAIAGLIAGVPRIVMSARSLPPFAIPNSSFPDKGQNYFYNNRFVRDLYQVLLTHPSVYLCHNSENGLEKYSEWLGGHENKMLLLRNGYDFSLEKRKSVSTTKKVPIIGSVFRFVEVKQPFLWLEAALLIHQKMPNVKFQMIGDGPLLEVSMNYASELGIENHVEFLGYREDVEDLLLNFDAFLLTSSIEGLPNVLIEAQSMGIPVISTNAGGARETFVNKQTGILVENSDPEVIANAVCDVITQQEYKQRAQTMGRDFVVERFSVEKMHTKLHHILFGELE